MPDDLLAELDVVLAAIHSSMRQSREVVTARVIKAMHNHMWISLPILPAVCCRAAHHWTWKWKLF